MRKYIVKQKAISALITCVLRELAWYNNGECRREAWEVGIKSKDNRNRNGILQ